MSIGEFERLIDNIKLEVEKGNVSAVLDNIVIVAEIAQTCNKTGLRAVIGMIKDRKK